MNYDMVSQGIYFLVWWLDRSKQGPSFYEQDLQLCTALSFSLSSSNDDGDDDLQRKTAKEHKS